jgi:hypothetical protein
VEKLILTCLEDRLKLVERQAQLDGLHKSLYHPPIGPVAKPIMRASKRRASCIGWPLVLNDGAPVGCFFRLRVWRGADYIQLSLNCPLAPERSERRPCCCPTRRS